jgi:Flagellar basal body rod protein
MDASLWISKTGLDAQQKRMSVISNNLANVNTTGFKRDRAVFEDLLSKMCARPVARRAPIPWHPRPDDGHGHPGACQEKIHAQGNMITTENALDIAVDGPGFFQSPRRRHHCLFARRRL